MVWLRKYTYQGVTIMLKKRIVKIHYYRATEAAKRGEQLPPYEIRIMQQLDALQKEYPNLEWDFTAYGENWVMCIIYKGYEYYEAN